MDSKSNVNVEALVPIPLRIEGDNFQQGVQMTADSLTFEDVVIATPTLVKEKLGKTMSLNIKGEPDINVSQVSKEPKIATPFSLSDSDGTSVKGISDLWDGMNGQLNVSGSQDGRQAHQLSYFSTDFHAVDDHVHPKGSLGSPGVLTLHGTLADQEGGGQKIQKNFSSNFGNSDLYVQDNAKLKIPVSQKGILSPRKGINSGNNFATIGILNGNEKHHSSGNNSQLPRRTGKSMSENSIVSDIKQKPTSDTNNDINVDFTVEAGKEIMLDNKVNSGGFEGNVDNGMEFSVPMRTRKRANEESQKTYSKVRVTGPKLQPVINGSHSDEKQVFGQPDKKDINMSYSRATMSNLVFPVGHPQYRGTEQQMTPAAIVSSEVEKESSLRSSPTYLKQNKLGMWVYKDPTLKVADYLIAIAQVIGKSNIVQLGAHSMKKVDFYVRREEDADRLYGEGIEVSGNFVQVYRLAQKPERIVLNAVDHWVPDSIIIEALAKFGEVGSGDIRKLKVGLEGFGHVLTYRREVFVRLHEDASPLPNRLLVYFEGVRHIFPLEAGEIKCYVCGNRGHVARNCRTRKKKVDKYKGIGISQASGDNTLPKEALGNVKYDLSREQRTVLENVVLSEDRLAEASGKPTQGSAEDLVCNVKGDKMSVNKDKTITGSENPSDNQEFPISSHVAITQVRKNALFAEEKCPNVRGVMLAHFKEIGDKILEEEGKDRKSRPDDLSSFDPSSEDDNDKFQWNDFKGEDNDNNDASMISNEEVHKFAWPSPRSCLTKNRPSNFPMKEWKRVLVLQDQAVAYADTGDTRHICQQYKQLKSIIDKQYRLLVNKDATPFLLKFLKFSEVSSRSLRSKK